ANIVTIHSIEEMDGTDFIVMEYVEGETLAAKLQRGTLLLPELIDINCQIAEGLAAAHDAGIIHRDIKAPNILITQNGRVKILDFGLAKVTAVPVEDLPTGFQEITEEGTILGTISYMSPEQVRGEVLDSRSDIFSFGCVLYECATGRLPFRGPNPTSVMYQITTAAVIPPSTLRNDLPKQLDAVLLRALAKEKGFRYSSAREMRDDLNALNFPETIAVSVHSGSFAMSKREEGFVGREKELGKLQEYFQRMMAGSGSTVFLTGEPGIGKTSLAEEFLRSIVGSFPEILTGHGRCVEHYGTGEAYLPFLDAIGGTLNGPLKEKVTHVLRTHAPTWCMQFPAAFATTGALENSKKEAESASKERMLREISDALIELSATFPVVLFFEDLHWADPSSADLLRYLCRRVQGQRMLILGTLRDEDLESGNPPMKACRLDLQAHSISTEMHMDLLTQAQV
ncbi:MAG: serine/threonine-protein kinase PknK, partial [Acidobacteriota bacterium]